MEYGLWRDIIPHKVDESCVLILVVMEYGLWLFEFNNSFQKYFVLILVVMEYGLWQLIFIPFKTLYMSLNPCCDGIWSLTFIWKLTKHYIFLKS